MAIEQFVNNANSTLSVAANTSQTTITVTSATPFSAIGNFRIIIDSEYMLVTSGSGAVFTVTRAIEGTTAASHGIGNTVTQILTNGGLLSILCSIISPGGRLTLTSATPVMSADVTAVSNVFYDTYKSKIIPINGALYEIASNELKLTLDTTNHIGGSIYDIFAISSNNLAKLVTGPAWTSNTARNLAIQLNNGIWVNSGTLTHAYNNAVDYGSITANNGTYLGSVYCTDNGQTSMQFNPTPIATGANAFMALYNAYNREILNCISCDNTASWSYQSTTWRGTNGSANNRVTVIDGLGQSPVSGYLSIAIQTPSNISASIGININSITATPTVVTIENTNNQTNWQIQVEQSFKPTLGLNFYQGMEVTGSAAPGNFYGLIAAGFQDHALIISTSI